MNFWETNGGYATGEAIKRAAQGIQNNNELLKDLISSIQDLNKSVYALNKDIEKLLVERKEDTEDKDNPYKDEEYEL